MIAAKAYLIRESGIVPGIEEIQLAEELSRGQVRLRVLYSGLCATQMEEIFVSSRNAKYMPHLFGHEGVGVIEAIGPGVETKRVGDTCVIHWRQSSVGIDAEPGQYFSSGRKVNCGKVVTFSTHVVVPENRVTNLPDGFPMDRAALLGCSLTTGWGSVAKVGSHNANDCVLVVGLGAVGTAAAWSARLRGSSVVLGLDTKTSKSASWRNSGVTAFFSNLAEFDGNSPERPSLDMVSLALDTSGNTEVIEYLLNKLPRSSRLVLVGMPSSSNLPQLNFQRLLDGLSLLGSNGGAVDPGLEIEIVAGLFRKLFDKELANFSKVFGSHDLWLAISEFSSGHSLRPILSFAQESDQHAH